MHLRVKGSHTPLSQSVAAWQRLPKPHRLLTCNAQMPPLQSNVVSSGSSSRNTFRQRKKNFSLESSKRKQHTASTKQQQALL